MFLFDFVVAFAIVGGAAAIFYFFFFNSAQPAAQKKVEAPAATQKAAAPQQQKQKAAPAAKKVQQQQQQVASPVSSAPSSPASPSKPKKTKEEKKAQKERVAKARAEKEAELDALVAADLKTAQQGIRNDSRRGVATTLEEANQQREAKAAKKAEAKAANKPAAPIEEELEEGFVAVKSENKKPINKKVNHKAEVDREVMTAAEEMDRRLRMFFSQSNSGKKYSSANYGNDDRKTDGPIRIKAGANKGWGAEN